MKFNCLIVDDDLIERKVLAFFFGRLDHLNLVAQCSDGNEAAAVLAKEDIDIVFSDIEMPDLSGIDLLKTLEHPPAFIFITSYSEYAAASFDLNVIDFIVKPVSFERFVKAANKAAEYIEFKKLLKNSEINREVSDQQHTPFKDCTDEYCFIKEAHGITKLRYADVLYIESLGDFSKIYTLQNKKHVTLVSLKNLEKQLPSPIFRRVHKQYIGNTDHIVTITGKDIHMSDNQHIPLGALYRQALLDHVVNKKVITRFAG